MGIIIKPVITEKTTALTEKTAERYVFRVSPDANKVEIKKAIEALYQVKVESVNTVNYSGKRKVAAFKKAIVTLEKGQTIDFYANI